ncbi:MAG: tetratricopeptide repeat protein [Pyrinomonadaceae bacterium]
MHRNTLAYVIVALVAGFIGGFWLANSINRSAATSGPVGNTMIQSTDPAAPSTATGNDLSPQEIAAKVAEADKNPDNFAFQKSLGIGLYRYAAMSSDALLLAESARILERAIALNSRDFDVAVALGNAYFDIGYAKKDRSSFEKAREFYSRALVIKPAEPDVRTDIGISYYVEEPANYAKAASELEAVGQANPKHDRSMQFLAQVYLKQNKVADARRVAAKIREINPANAALAELEVQIASAQGTK